MEQHRHSRDAAAKALETEEPNVDLAVTMIDCEAPRSRQLAQSERSLESIHALEKRVVELEQRLAKQETRCCEHTVLLHSSLERQRDSDVSSPPREHEPLIEFFLTEMEKYQTMTAKLSLAHTKLQQELHEHEQGLERFRSDQNLRMHKYLEIMRRMEKEFVHGEQLRGEEKQLAVAQSKKRVEAVKRTVNEQLDALRAQGDQHRSELEEKLEKKFVDVVVESQTLRAENMVVNKKTIRILTEEILKIKRTAVVYPTDVDELLALQRGSTRGSLSAFATAAAVHPSKPYHAA